MITRISTIITIIITPLNTKRKRKNSQLLCQTFPVSFTRPLGSPPQVQVLVSTWQDLQKTTDELTTKMSDVPNTDDPKIEELEKVFASMKELFAKKKELLTTV